MKETRQNCFKGKEVFVGIDVHKKSYSLAIKVATQEGVRKITSPADPNQISQYLVKNYSGANIHSTYEAGFSGFDLHRKLINCGIKNVVVNPSSIPVASNDRVKTDKRDAVRLVKLLSNGELEPIKIPTEQQEQQRLLSRTREQLVKHQTRIGNQIKSRLMQFGKMSYLQEQSMSLKFLKALQSRDDLEEELKVTIRVLSTIYIQVHTQIVEVERLIKQQMKANKLTTVYKSVPGVGDISASILSNELGDMSHFRNERTVFSFTGLTPCEFSSGEHIRKGHISRQGSSRLRHCLVEISWRAIRQDKSLEQIYERVKRTRGGKRAIVAVARRLAGRIRACVRDGQPYRLAA